MATLSKYQWYAYQQEFDGRMTRHYFREYEEMRLWLNETMGLSLASEGGRGFLTKCQEEKFTYTVPNIYH